VLIPVDDAGKGLAELMVLKVGEEINLSTSSDTTGAIEVSS